MGERRFPIVFSTRIKEQKTMKIKTKEQSNEKDVIKRKENILI